MSSGHLQTPHDSKVAFYFELLLILYNVSRLGNLENVFILPSIWIVMDSRDIFNYHARSNSGLFQGHND